MQTGKPTQQVFPRYLTQFIMKFHVCFQRNTTGMKNNSCFENWLSENVICCDFELWISNWVLFMNIKISFFFAFAIYGILYSIWQSWHFHFFIELILDKGYSLCCKKKLKIQVHCIFQNGHKKNMGRNFIACFTK